HLLWKDLLTPCTNWIFFANLCRHDPNLDITPLSRSSIVTILLSIAKKKDGSTSSPRCHNSISKS
ncbi:MAG: hypothetical protein AAB244_07560, partial [Nitrospirota bacterium]